MIIKDKYNYSGLKHDQLVKKISKNCTYINTFLTNDSNYYPSAVYKINDLNNDNYTIAYRKGYYDENEQTKVERVSIGDLEKYRHQPAIKCNYCSEIIYAPMKNVSFSCSCRKCMIFYGRTLVCFDSHGEQVVYDVLTDEVVQKGLLDTVVTKERT